MARLAAFDMDGTLLMPDHHLGEKTLSTLARLRERDITLTFATGRHALEMQHILGALSLDAYIRRACTFMFFRHGLPRSAAGGLQ